MKPSNSSKNKKSSDIPLNRGVDLILNGAKKQSHLLDLKFNKVVIAFRWKIKINFNFLFDIKKI